jgi:hypothetical protein
MDYVISDVPAIRRLSAPLKWPMHMTVADGCLPRRVDGPAFSSSLSPLFGPPPVIAPAIFPVFGTSPLI